MWWIRLSLVAVVVASLSGLYLKGRYDGAASADARWEQAMAAERQAQKQIFAEALKAERERFEEMERDNAKSAERANEVERDAENDATACLVDPATREALESIR